MRFLIAFLLLVGVSYAQETGKVVGRIEDPALCESSGLAASRRFSGVYWSHNDSGNPSVLFALNSTGKSLARFDVAAPNVDWEDIAFDPAGHLYLADVGNNTGRRQSVQVYQIDEPDPARPPTGPLPVVRKWDLRYPTGAFDCEALFIHDGHGYLVAKVAGIPPGVFRFKLDGDQRQTLEHVGQLPLWAPVTAADLSSDGKWLAVMTFLGPYVFDFDGDPRKMARAQPRHWRHIDMSMEAVCFDSGGLLASTENRLLLRFQIED